MEQSKEVTITLSDVQLEALNRGESIAVKIEPKSEDTTKGKWIPKGGEFIVNMLSGCNTEDSMLNRARLLGLTYETQEQADFVTKQLKIVAKLYAFLFENNPSYKPVWDGVNENYYITFKSTPKLPNEDNTFKVVGSPRWEVIGLPYMDENSCYKLVHLLNHGGIEL